MPGVFQILSHTIVKGLFVETLIGATTLPSHATRDSWAVYNPGLDGMAHLTRYPFWLRVPTRHLDAIVRYLNVEQHIPVTRSRNNRMRGVHMPALESPQSIDGETLALALREAGGLPELPVARSSGTQHAMAAVCDSLRLADADARVIGCVEVIFSIGPSFSAGSKNRLFYAGIMPV